MTDAPLQYQPLPAGPPEAPPLPPATVALNCALALMLDLSHVQAALASTTRVLTTGRPPEMEALRRAAGDVRHTLRTMDAMASRMLGAVDEVPETKGR